MGGAEDGGCDGVIDGVFDGEIVGVSVGENVGARVGLSSQMVLDMVSASQHELINTHQTPLHEEISKGSICVVAS